ncbi:MAG: thymidine phosphorylase, partial [Wenzhouxiangellaceae bacterium]
MLPQEIIRAKRDGKRLSEDEIRQFVAGITEDSVAQEQLGAFAMAVFLNGMERDETVALTLAMRDSGRVMQWPGLDGPVLDKHSTGGVGDTVSLILGPWVAACGGYVPMISGRGLGHTGGTLDKVGAIPGYDAFPAPDRLDHIVREVGCAIIGQTDDLAPADRRFYAARDVTATVECLPLIVASILSKKLAAGLDGLVMDVKTGSGSVMGSLERAVELAEAIGSVSGEAGTPASTLVTDMNQVLATTAGNALEVAEAIAILDGRIRDGRLLEVTRELAAEMLILGRLAEDPEQAFIRLDRVLASGEVAERFARMVEAMGGPSDLLEQPERHLARAPVCLDVFAENAGIITTIDVRAVGLAVVELGGGRRRANDEIDPAVGLSEIAGLGEAVDPHRPLARVHARNQADAQLAAQRLQSAFEITDRQADREAIVPPLVHRRVPVIQSV